MSNDIKELDSQTARQEFIKLRNKMERVIAQTPLNQLDETFGEAFGEIYTDATLGDIVAQDYVATFLNEEKKVLFPKILTYLWNG